MSTIKVECTDQVLRIMESPTIASGGVNEDYVQFTFCPLWDGYTKTAVFYMDENFVYHSSVDDENKCVIPKEAMNDKGKMYFGVFGVNGDIVRTSEVLPYIIKKGAITQGATPEPTPDIYAQILTALSNKVDKVTGKGLSTNDYDDAEKAAVAANTSARHTHSNKAYLDGLSDTYINGLIDAKLGVIENGNY